LTAHRDSPGERELFLAAVRETLADHRETAADERDLIADARERAVDAREANLDLRERRLEGRHGTEGRERQLEGRERQLEGRERQLEGRHGPEGREDLLGQTDPAATVRRQRLRRPRDAESRRRAEHRWVQAGRRDVSERWKLGGEMTRQFAFLAAELYCEDTLEAVLRRITAAAVTAVPGCDVATVTFVEGGRYWTPVASDPSGETLDRVQYSLRQGPCVDATESAVCEGSGDWSRWPALAEPFNSRSVNAVLSCRIAVGAGRQRPDKASLNFYSTVSGGFEPESRDAATILAAHASVAVGTARERAAASETLEGFRQALASRQVIGQATGMLMERQGITAEDAFDILRRASQRMNVKLRDVAASLATSRQPIVGESERPDYEQLGRALDYMLDASHTVRADRLPMLTHNAAERFGVTSTTVFLPDVADRRLLPFADPGAQPFDIDGTVGGRAYIGGEPVELHHDDGTVTLWAPLIDGVERVGVVAFSVDGIDDNRRGALAKIVALLAGELVTRGQYSDAVRTARRESEMTITAEMTWERTPPPAFSSDAVSLAAGLQPSYTVAGDAYDYAYNHPDLHLAVIDAVGHDLRAGLIADLVVSAYRHARRRGEALQESVASIDAIINSHFAGDSFATAIVASLDTTNGSLTFVNAGHPPPLLLREGQIIGALDAPLRPPLGLGDTIRPGTSTGIGYTQLEPDDRILFYTDGIIEARSATGEDFGLHRLEDFIRRHLTSGRSDSEFVRRLIHAVVDHHHGQLNDDATLVVLRWSHSDHPEN
jgi:hypothetical protein